MRFHQRSQISVLYVGPSFIKNAPHNTCKPSWSACGRLPQVRRKCRGPIMYRRSRTAVAAVLTVVVVLPFREAVAPCCEYHNKSWRSGKKRFRETAFHLIITVRMTTTMMKRTMLWQQFLPKATTDGVTDDNNDRIPNAWSDSNQPFDPGCKLSTELQQQQQQTNS